MFLKLKGTDDPEKYSFTIRPVLTFRGDSVLIETDSIEISTGYKYSEIEKFYFEVVEEILPSPEPEAEEKPDAIDELQEDAAEKVSFEFAYDGRTARIKGLGEAPKVAVFNTAGVRVQPKTDISNGAVAIAMYELPAGIYVIRANDRSFKIIKK